MYNPFSLEGKTILITGASSGIGRGIAIECSKMGANVIITARNAERLNDTFISLEGNGHSQLITDLSNQTEIENLANKCPVLDGFVNSAGIPKLIPVKFIQRDSLNEIMNINTFAPIILTSLLLKCKKIRKNSSIVYVSSIAGVKASEIGGSTYAASKGAINGFIMGAAIDLAPQNIRVNSVNPGLIKTSILELASTLFSDEQIQGKINQYPLKCFGMPEDVAFGVIYFLSDASRWVTGSTLVIDGGFTLL